MIHKIESAQNARWSKDEQPWEMYKSCNITCHPHKDGLGGQLKRPEANFFESSHASLVIHHISGEGVVCLDGKGQLETQET